MNNNSPDYYIPSFEETPYYEETGQEYNFDTIKKESHHHYHHLDERGNHSWCTPSTCNCLLFQNQNMYYNQQLLMQNHQIKTELFELKRDFYTIIKSLDEIKTLLYKSDQDKIEMKRVYNKQHYQKRKQKEKEMNETQ